MMQIYVNRWQFPPGCDGLTEGIFQSLCNWKLPRLSSTIKLSSEVVVRCDWFRVYGRKKNARFSVGFFACRPVVH